MGAIFVLNVQEPLSKNKQDHKNLLLRKKKLILATKEWMQYKQIGENMIPIGRLCIKLAGRDANKKCVIVDVLSNNFVLIDGETRRKKCNIKHLEFLNQTVSLSKGASHQDVASAFSAMGISLIEKKSKPKTQKPLAKRKQVKKQKTT